MDNFIDRGYEIIKELGANRGAGRVAYLARQLDNDRLVVIKQFQFARSNSSWDGYKEIEREVAILKQLQHPNIPRYLATFETEQGSCIVQEYIDGRPLSEIISSQQLFTPEQVKEIVAKLLEILIYLQESFTEPILHRDIKPVNILIDGDLQPFLIDFGGAKVSESVGGSTVAIGTLGFMPPEQRFQQFNKTTDVYSLGLTLVCWLTRTEPTEMYSIINMGTNQVMGLRKSLSTYSLRFVDWLEKVVQPDPKDRYPDAKTGLKAFDPLYVKRLPEAVLSSSELEFAASKLGELLFQTLTVYNGVPETILEGWWEVAPHPSDPPHTPHAHAWISFGARKFAGTDINCEISIDTSKLKAGTTYLRTILLHTNSIPEVREIQVKVWTAAIPQSQPVPYRQMVSNITIPLALAVEISVLMYLRSIIYADLSFLQNYQLGGLVVAHYIICGVVGIAMYWLLRIIFGEDSENYILLMVSCFLTVLFETLVITPGLIMALRMAVPILGIEVRRQITSIIADVITAIAIGTANTYLWQKLRLKLYFKTRSINLTAFLTGCLYGFSALIQLPATILIPILVLETTPLAGVLIYNSVQMRRKIEQYRKLEQSSIDS